MLSEARPKFIGKRISATIVDYTIIFGLTIFYISTVGHETSEAKYSVEGLPALVPLVFWFMYFVVCESFLEGTIGHQIMKLKVVTLSGSKPSFEQTLTRRLCDVIEIGWCFGFIAFLIVYKNDAAQRLDDILSKTIVIGTDNTST